MATSPSLPSSPHLAQLSWHTAHPTNSIPKSAEKDSFNKTLLKVSLESEGISIWIPLCEKLNIYNSLPFCFRRNPKILDFLDNHTPAVTRNKENRLRFPRHSSARFRACSAFPGFPGCTTWDGQQKTVVSKSAYQTKTILVWAFCFLGWQTSTVSKCHVYLL